MSNKSVQKALFRVTRGGKIKRGTFRKLASPPPRKLTVYDLIARMT